MKTIYRMKNPSTCQTIFLLIMICQLFSFDVTAQYRHLNSRTSAGKPFIYADANVGYVGAGYIGIGQSIILANQWGVHVGYIKGIRKSAEKPSDYHNETTSFWGPVDHFNATSLRVARIISTNKTDIRFKAELGIARLNYQTVHFTQYTPTPSSSAAILDAFFDLFGSYGSSNSYHTSYATDKSLGLSTRLSTEFPFAQLFGMQVALLGTFTPKHTLIVLEAGISLGRVREKIYE